jgi:hypothetical protein
METLALPLKYDPVGFPPVMGSSPHPSFQDIGLRQILFIYLFSLPRKLYLNTEIK